LYESEIEKVYVSETSRWEKKSNFKAIARTWQVWRTRPMVLASPPSRSKKQRNKSYHNHRPNQPILNTKEANPKSTAAGNCCQVDLDRDQTVRKGRAAKRCLGGAAQLIFWELNHQAPRRNHHLLPNEAGQFIGVEKRAIQARNQKRQRSHRWS